MDRTHSRRGPRQHGFALIELAIAMAVACMAAIWASNKLVQDVEDAAAQASGVWLAEIKRALDQMLARHFDTLAANGTPLDALGQPAYAQPFAPRLDELKAQGHLPPAFPEQAALGLRADVRIVRGTACPGEGCRLDALAYSRAPLLRPGSPVPDFMRIAGVIMAAGGAGGSVSADAPVRVRGANFDFPNPPVPGMAVLPPGTVAVWAGFDTTMNQRFLRLGDERDPDFHGDASIAGTIRAGGRVTAGEHLQLGAVASAGAACAPAGLLARDAGGGTLSCVAGHWSVPGGFGGAYSWNYKYGCAAYTGHSTANPRTGACSCPAGFAEVIVSNGGKWTETEGWTTGYVCVR